HWTSYRNKTVDHSYAAGFPKSSADQPSCAKIVREVGQTVAGMRHRQRKVRAPQSRVLGNAQASRDDDKGHRDESRCAIERSCVAGETRQPPPGATSNRQTTTLLAESAGRWLEPRGDSGPRGMTVHDRTRLIGQLHFFFAPAQTGANFF